MAMLSNVSGGDPAEQLRELEAECRKELDQTREQLSEIQLLLQQSNSEAEKLAQREASIVTRVRDMEINLENYTRNDIKTVYSTSQEVSLRLFMMRSQVEQLQMRQQHVKEHQESLGTLLTLLARVSGEEFQTNSSGNQVAKPSIEQVAAASSLSGVIQAQESERQRVARYLHDGPAMRLTNLVLKTEICEHMVERDPAEAKSELVGLRSSLTSLLQEMRRLLYDLRPLTLDELGVVPTLRRYLNDVARRDGYTATVHGPDGADEMPVATRALVFRVVQDIVSGMASGSKLEEVMVDLTPNDGNLSLTIDVRVAADGAPPAIDSVMQQEQIAQRLFMLSATTEIAAIGDRGIQVVVTAAPAAA